MVKLSHIIGDIVQEQTLKQLVLNEKKEQTPIPVSVPAEQKSPTT